MEHLIMIIMICEVITAIVVISNGNENFNNDNDGNNVNNNDINNENRYENPHKKIN